MGDVRSEDQWVSLRVFNRMRTHDIEFKNASLSWGKWYSGSKSNEISAATVDETVIHPDITKSADSCGREGSWSGVQGSLDLYDGKTKICTLWWDSPWGSAINEFQVFDYSAKTSPYAVSIGTWRQRDGPLGNIDISVALLA
ncbi:aegerolysin type hemolysin [Trichoderma sp. SZMC 28014]